MHHKTLAHRRRSVTRKTRPFSTTLVTCPGQRANAPFPRMSSPMQPTTRPSRASTASPSGQTVRIPALFRPCPSQSSRHSPIAPTGNIVPVGNGTQGLGIFPVVNWLSCATDHAITYYNTMVLIDAVDPAATGSPTVTADRVVPRLFYVRETPRPGRLALHRHVLLLTVRGSPRRSCTARLPCIKA